MLKNKSANILAFDEVIGTNTSFEGNDSRDSIKEMQKIIKLLIDKKYY